MRIELALLLSLSSKWTNAPVPVPRPNSNSVLQWRRGVPGKDRWLGSLESIGERIRGATDSAIWQCRTSGRRSRQVEFGAVNPSAVRVELYAEPLDENPAFRQEMTRRTGQSNDGRIDEFFATVPTIRSAADFTARVAPTYPGVQVPLEAPHVLWQR